MTCNDCPHHIADFVEKERFKEQRPYGIEESLNPINFSAQTIENLRSQWDAHYQTERYDYESE